MNQVKIFRPNGKGELVLFEIIPPEILVLYDSSARKNKSHSWRKQTIESYKKRITK